MSYETRFGVTINSPVINNYFSALINKFFKILPIKEQSEETLSSYAESLQIEMLGCKNLIPLFYEDKDFATLLFILQYIIDNPDVSAKVVKREVFKAISICEKMQRKLQTDEDGELSNERMGSLPN